LADKLDEFVAAGGTLIAAGQSGFYDAEHEPRPTPALQCLGIERVELVREDMRLRPGLNSGYLKLDDKTGFPRFAVTDLIYLDAPYIYCQYAPEAVQRFRLVAPHNFGPPERCYYGQPEAWSGIVDRPGFVVNPYGQGQAIYLPWLPGTLFHRQGHTNTADFVADLLENVAGIAPVGGNLGPMVEVTLLKSNVDGSLLVHLVNGSGHFGTSFYAPVPMHHVQVEIPCSAQPRHVTSLVTEKAVPSQFANGTLSMTVPRLDLFEALQIVL